jgi:hypothetical protein
MENAMVTVPLAQIDALRDKVKKAEERAEHFKNQKEFNVSISVDMYYEGTRKYAHHVYSFGDMQMIRQFSDGDGYREACALIKDAFDKVMLDSKEMRFYRKVPKWLIRFFKCD